MKRLLGLLMLLAPLSEGFAGNPVKKIEKKAQEIVDSSRFLSGAGRTWKVITASGIKDPQYLRSPDWTWKIKTTSGISYADLFDRGSFKDGRFRAALWSEPRIRQSFSLGWKFLSASYSFNPFRLRGKDKDNLWSFSWFCNRFGVELSARQAKTYHGRVLMEPDAFSVNAGKVASRLINLDGYYVLNCRKYSLPTALSQSFIQKKSAGSLIFSFSGQMADISCGSIEGLGNRPFRIESSVLGCGAGYGYNWVPWPRIVVSGAAIGNVMLLCRSRITVEEEPSKMKRRFPDYSLSAYIALAYQSGMWHYGIRGIAHDCCVGDNRHQVYDNVSLDACFFIGVRIK